MHFLQLAPQSRQELQLGLVENLLAHDVTTLDRPVTIQGVVVGSMLAIDHILAEPERSLNDHSVFATMHRINGKEHPGLLRS